MSRATTGKPTVNRKKAVQLFNFLKGKGWQNRKDIPMQPRLVRAICSEFPEHFISSQRGYRITAEATTEELQISIADLNSRLKHMARRRDAMQGVVDARVSQQRSMPL